MKRKNLYYEIHHEYETPNDDVIRECFIKAIEEQFVKPVFGENNEYVTNLTYLGVTQTDNSTYACIDFDTGGDKIFRIRFYPKRTNNKTVDADVYFEIVDKSKRNTIVYDTNITGYISSRVDISSGDGYTNYTISGTIDYLMVGTEIKAIWLTSDSPGVVTFDSISFVGDNTTEKTISLIGTTGIKVYRINQSVLSSILSETREFSIDHKVYIEKIYILENDNIVAFFDNMTRIFNNSLGTTVFTEGSYKKLIDVDGVKYRQLAGPYWIEDKD